MPRDIDFNTDEVIDYPIRKAFQTFYPSYSSSHKVSSEQAKTAACISNCKTGRLGYIVSECPECGYQKMHARSCNNRDCPCCQAPLEKKWIMERNSELIPGIAYYHVVFTIPAELNALMYANQKVLFNLLFSAASKTLITLCKDKKYMGAVPGIVSVLHTWGQRLNFHPHLHVMLTGGGLTSDNKFIVTKHKGFIIPLSVIGALFRGKFLAGLKKLYDSGKLSLEGSSSHLKNHYSWKEFINGLYSKKWLPFIKETFNGNGNAVEYLAKYAYRTAISNSRIVDVNNETVSIRYTDYADNNQKKILTVEGIEFLRLFLQHVLPQGFHRVRFGGFLANCQRRKKLRLIAKLLKLKVSYFKNPLKGKKTEELMKILYGAEINCCPCCHHEMRPIFSCSFHPPNIE